MYTLAQAAKTIGKSKSTVLRAVKSGKISSDKDAHGQYQISPAELHRVYPVASGDASVNRSNGDPRTTRDVLHDTAESEISKAKLDAAERIIVKHEETIADLRDRLDTEGEERRKLTAMLTDQRPKGFWARITGR